MRKSNWMKRKCNKCPEPTKAVCEHAFGVYWCVKSNDGDGCDHPLDEVAEAWSKANWNGEAVPVALPEKKPSKLIKLEQKDLFKQELTDDDY